VRKAQQIAKTIHRQPLEQSPRQVFVPRRKNPWLLALCVNVLAAWLIFLAYLAVRG
jgi:hypothetical protein